MISLHSRYLISIIDSPFVGESGFVFPKTASITIYDSLGEVQMVADYGHLPTEQIYELIDKGDTIDLSNSFIENFSLTAYRRTRLLHKKSIVTLKGFCARNSFFRSKYEIDFSYSDFGDHPVDFQNCYFGGGMVNFYRARFGCADVNFVEAKFKQRNVLFAKMYHEKGNFLFRAAQFGEGEKNFQDARFGEGEKSWRETDFGEGDLNFINVNFGPGCVSFRFITKSVGNTDFHFSNFGNGQQLFESAHWGDGEFNFNRVTIGNSKTVFNRCTFGEGTKNFDGIVSDGGKFSCKWADFGAGNISFEEAEMENSKLSFDKSRFDRGKTAMVSFNKSKFQSLSLRSCHLDDYFDLRIAKADYIDLSDTIVRDIINLQACPGTVILNELRIAHMQLLGQINIDWEANNLKAVIANQGEKDMRLQAEQYRILKENFWKTGRYADEDKAYVEFKRAEQIADLHDSVSRNAVSAIWEYPYYWSKHVIFDKIGQYATNPVRVMLSMVILFVVCSLLFYFMELAGLGEIFSIVPSANADVSELGKAFFFSAVTFFTIGYGDFIPIGNAFRVLSGLEGFLGLFLMSYFTVAFVRKILR